MTKITFLLSSCLALLACGGGPQDSVQDKPQVSLIAFMYGNTKSRISYGAAGGDVITRLDAAGLLYPDVSVFEMKVTYENTDLPQVAAHLIKPGNTKLLIYSNGHVGLPTPDQGFVREFIRGALDADMDVLFTSMPLIGLNTPIPGKTYSAKLHGSSRQTVLSEDLIGPQSPHLHAVYMGMVDPDHWMHFFIDPIVLFADNVGVTKGALGLQAGARGFPEFNYRAVSFVGISGGGHNGLIACAVMPFDKCIIVAGFLPIYLRSGRDWGDQEQFADSFNSQYPFERLMELAAQKTRRMVYLYNDQDPCCFANPQAAEFAKDFPAYDIRVLPSTAHAYDPAYVLDELTSP